MLKRVIIFLVKYYQNHKPERLEGVCVFEPTCSTYMILAIEKYGLLKGFWKGIKRLSMCHHPNGGIDYP